MIQGGVDICWSAKGKFDLKNDTHKLATPQLYCSARKTNHNREDDNSNTAIKDKLIHRLDSTPVRIVSKWMYCKIAKLSNSFSQIWNENLKFWNDYYLLNYFVYDMVFFVFKLLFLFQKCQWNFLYSSDRRIFLNCQREIV